MTTPDPNKPPVENPPPTPPPSDVPKKVEKIAEQAESGELDVTAAIIQAYKQGKTDEKAEIEEKARSTSGGSKKGCWYCGTEGCVFCTRKNS